VFLKAPELLSNLTMQIRGFAFWKG